MAHRRWSSKLKLKKALGIFAVLTVAVLSFAAWVYFQVEGHDDVIYSNVDDVPVTPAAIVFGAGIDSPEVHDRVRTACALYKQGKVAKLLMTGDNGHITYNEPEAMRQEAIKLGVPSENVVCDYAGFRTYDSIYRAREIFGLTKAVLVTQRYHLPRAIYLSRSLGLDVVGFDASKQSYGSIQTWYDLREVGAAQAAWLDVVTGRKPKFLGKKEPLFPEGAVN